MQPPELPTPEENKRIAEMIETDVDHALKEHKLREVPTLFEGLGNIDEDDDGGDLRSVVR